MRKMIAYAESGVAHSFNCFDESGALIWDTISAAFVAFVDADYLRYRVAATEVGTSRRYVGTAPNGTVYYELREDGPSLATSYPRWDGTFTTEEIKADADLGTASGGMVSNAAQVLNVPRAAAPVTAGGATTRNKVSATSTALVESIS